MFQNSKTGCKLERRVKKYVHQRLFHRTFTTFQFLNSAKAFWDLTLSLNLLQISTFPYLFNAIKLYLWAGERIPPSRYWVHFIAECKFVHG